jgi:DNA-binding GntR family transcriptional regulator
MAALSLDGVRLDRSRPLRDQIYALLRETILTGALAPGEAVDEKAIAAALRVSRTPVHEAVKKLADEELVEIRAQSGTLVARIDPRRIAEAHVIRRALEVESAGLAAEKMTEVAADRLEDLHMLHAAAIERGQFVEAIRRDDAFHRGIAEVAGLPALWRAVEISKGQLDRCRHATLPREGAGAATLAEHRAILDALRRRDGPAARAAMAAHLDNAYRTIIGFLATLRAAE